MKKLKYTLLAASAIMIVGTAAVPAPTFAADAFGSIAGANADTEATVYGVQQIADSVKKSSTSVTNTSSLNASLAAAGKDAVKTLTTNATSLKTDADLLAELIKEYNASQRLTNGGYDPDGALRQKLDEQAAALLKRAQDLESQRGNFVSSLDTSLLSKNTGNKTIASMFNQVLVTSSTIAATIALNKIPTTTPTITPPTTTVNTGLYTADMTILHGSSNAYNQIELPSGEGGNRFGADKWGIGYYTYVRTADTPASTGNIYGVAGNPEYNANMAARDNGGGIVYQGNIAKGNVKLLNMDTAIGEQTATALKAQLNSIKTGTPELDAYYRKLATTISADTTGESAWVSIAEPTGFAKYVADQYSPAPIEQIKTSLTQGRNDLYSALETNNGPDLRSTATEKVGNYSSQIQEAIRNLKTPTLALKGYYDSVADSITPNTTATQIINKLQNASAASAFEIKSVPKVNTADLKYPMDSLGTKVLNGIGADGLYKPSKDTVIFKGEESLSKLPDLSVKEIVSGGPSSARNSTGKPINVGDVLIKSGNNSTADEIAFLKSATSALESAPKPILTAKGGPLATISTYTGSMAMAGLAISAISTMIGNQSAKGSPGQNAIIAINDAQLALNIAATTFPKAAGPLGLGVNLLSGINVSIKEYYDSGSFISAVKAGGATTGLGGAITVAMYKGPDIAGNIASQLFTKAAGQSTRIVAAEIVGGVATPLLTAYGVGSLGAYMIDEISEKDSREMNTIINKTGNSYSSVLNKQGVPALDGLHNEELSAIIYDGSYMSHLIGNEDATGALTKDQTPASMQAKLDAAKKKLASDYKWELKFGLYPRKWVEQEGKLRAAQLQLNNYSNIVYLQQKAKADAEKAAADARRANQCDAGGGTTYGWCVAGLKSAPITSKLSDDQIKLMKLNAKAVADHLADLQRDAEVKKNAEEFKKAAAALIKFNKKNYTSFSLGAAFATGVNFGYSGSLSAAFDNSAAWGNQSGSNTGSGSSNNGGYDYGNNNSSNSSDNFGTDIGDFGNNNDYSNDAFSGGSDLGWGDGSQYNWDNTSGGGITIGYAPAAWW